MTAEQAANRQADRENLIRELVDAMRLIYCLAEFGTHGDIRAAIAKAAKDQLDKAKGQGYA